jgi:hypothetical protein
MDDKHRDQPTVRVPSRVVWRFGLASSPIR